MAALWNHTNRERFCGGYGRRELVSVWNSAPHGARRVVSFPLFKMNQVRCIECCHDKVMHFTDDGRPERRGCREYMGTFVHARRCGCQCRSESDFEEVTLHRYRIHNEWTYEAASEDQAKDMFADASADFAPDADVEQLPDDDGEITCHYYEWYRIDTQDVQDVAEDVLGRLLTEDELCRVKKPFSEALEWRRAVEVCMEIAEIK